MSDDKTNEADLVKWLVQMSADDPSLPYYKMALEALRSLNEGMERLSFDLVEATMRYLRAEALVNLKQPIPSGSQAVVDDPNLRRWLAPAMEIVVAKGYQFPRRFLEEEAKGGEQPARK